MPIEFSCPACRRPYRVKDEPAAEAPGFASLFFQTMFNPIDGLFMLLAFFTAYKVGSGKKTD